MLKRKELKSRSPGVTESQSHGITESRNHGVRYRRTYVLKKNYYRLEPKNWRGKSWQDDHELSKRCQPLGVWENKGSFNGKNIFSQQVLFNYFIARNIYFNYRNILMERNNALNFINLLCRMDPSTFCGWYYISFLPVYLAPKFITTSDHITII